MFVVLALVLALAGCVCLFLASPHQRVRNAPLPALRAWLGATACLGASLCAFGQALSLLPAIFALVSALMLFLVMTPYAAAAVAGRRR